MSSLCFLFDFQSNLPGAPSYSDVPQRERRHLLQISCFVKPLKTRSVSPVLFRDSVTVFFRHQRDLCPCLILVCFIRGPSSCYVFIVRLDLPLLSVFGWSDSSLLAGSLFCVSRVAFFPGSGVHASAVVLWPPGPETARFFFENQNPRLCLKPHWIFSLSAFVPSEGPHSSRIFGATSTVERTGSTSAALLGSSRPTG